MKKVHILKIGILVVLLLSFMNLYTTAEQNLTIPVEEGSFVFKDLSLASEKYLGPKLVEGAVLNNTSKDWNEVIFEIDLYDSAGNKLEGYAGDSFSFSLYHFKRGESRSIRESFSGIRDASSISRYEIRFKTGEYPAKYFFVMTKPKASKELVYKDRFLKMMFSITKKQFGFILHNGTKNPIKIDWNQVSYVDVLGKSHKVTHSGVKYVDRAKPQPPTVLPPTARLEDIVFPIDYTYFSSGKYGGWTEIPLFPEAPKAKIFKGKSFSVFMPLEINGVIKNYLFSFKIEDVES